MTATTILSEANIMNKHKCEAPDTYFDSMFNSGEKRKDAEQITGILDRPMLGKDLLTFKEDNRLTLSMAIAVTGVACPRIWYQLTRDEAKNTPIKDKSTALLLRLLVTYPEYQIISVRHPDLEQLVNDLGINFTTLAMILGRTEITGRTWATHRNEKKPKSVPSQPVTNLLNIIAYQINEYKKGVTQEDPKAFLRKIKSLLLIELKNRDINYSKLDKKTNI